MDSQVPLCAIGFRLHCCSYPIGRRDSSLRDQTRELNNGLCKPTRRCFAHSSASNGSSEAAENEDWPGISKQPTSCAIHLFRLDWQLWISDIIVQRLTFTGL